MTTTTTIPTMTPDQLKADFHRRGVTFTQWAIENGYNRNKVYRVVNGLDKGKYGRAHEIAVKLGLKNPGQQAA